MRVRTILLAAALMLAPLAARAADLVIWWEKGSYPEEDRAVEEVVAAFEQKTGKDVELVFWPDADFPKIVAALAAGSPPDLVFGVVIADHAGRWAFEDRLVDLGDTLGSLASLFEPLALDHATLPVGTKGRRSLYALPMGRATYHIHVWRSLLERAGFTLADIPKEWEPFWSFWCDQVQPAVRKATGRDDIWGVGVAMSAATTDATGAFAQFVNAYGANYVTRDGRLVMDEPLVRERLVKALAAETALLRKGCTPPDSIEWENSGNNRAFLERRVVMTTNGNLTIPRSLRSIRPDDYYKDAVTIEWPSAADGQPLAIRNGFFELVVFKAGGHSAAAKEFVRFLVENGGLAQWLSSAGDRFLPPMPTLLQAPFWLDPSDPHRMAAAIQFLTRPRDYSDAYAVISGDWRHSRVVAETVWAKAVNRVAADGISPERAVDKAIARIKQILSE